MYTFAYILFNYARIDDIINYDQLYFWVLWKEYMNLSTSFEYACAWTALWKISTFGEEIMGPGYKFLLRSLLPRISNREYFSLFYKIKVSNLFQLSKV